MEKNKTANAADESEYSILNYFANHVTTLISVLTIVVAAISFFGSMLSYYADYKVLYYWGWEPRLVTIDASNKLYSFAIVLIFNIGIILVQQLTLGFTQRYFEATSYQFASKYGVRRLIGCKKQLPKKSTELEAKEETDIINNEIDSITVKHSVAKRALFSRFIAQLVLCHILGILIGLLLLTSIFSNGVRFYIEFIIAFLYSLIIVGIAFFEAYKTKRTPIKKQINAAGNDGQEIVQICERIGEDSAECIIRQISNNTWYRKVFCNSNIKSVFFTQVIMLVVLFITILSTVDHTQSIRKDVHLCSFDDTQYSIVYRDKDSVYLNRAELNTDGSATVYVNEHRIEKAEGIKIQDYTLQEIRIER